MDIIELKAFVGKPVNLKIKRRAYWGVLLEPVDGKFSMKIGRLYLDIDPTLVSKIEEFHQDIPHSAWLSV